MRNYLAEFTGATIYRFHWWWRLILRWRTGGRREGWSLAQEMRGFHVARLSAMNQLPKVAYCDVVKLQGMWPSCGMRPTPARRYPSTNGHESHRRRESRHGGHRWQGALHLRSSSVNVQSKLYSVCLTEQFVGH
jgi:hypothetical protein